MSMAVGLGVRVLITPVAMRVLSVRVVRSESIGSTDSWRSFWGGGHWGLVDYADFLCEVSSSSSIFYFLFLGRTDSTLFV